MLEIKDIHSYYGKSHVLEGVSLTVGEGELVTLLGRNGAGKTTTISMLTGMLKPSAGFATVYGYDVFQQDLDDVRRFMGVCP